MPYSILFWRSFPFCLLFYLCSEWKRNILYSWIKRKHFREAEDTENLYWNQWVRQSGRGSDCVSMSPPKIFILYMQKNIYKNWLVIYNLIIKFVQKNLEMFPEKEWWNYEGGNRMEDQRKNELAVVIAATVVFGFMNRILIRIPYMVLGDFSFSFLISVVTWWILEKITVSQESNWKWTEEGKWMEEK